MLGQTAGDALTLEHALTMLLLLVGLLSIQREQRRYVPWVVLAGVALSLFTPVHTLSISWPIILALVLPPLLWQVAVRLATTAHSEFTWRAWLAWILTALLIGLALGVGAKMSPAGSVLLGILAASLMWQVRERTVGSTELGAFGQLALAFLLVEVDVILHQLDLFLGSLFVGASLGLILGYIGVRVAFRLPKGDARNYFCLGLAYVAYLAGTLIGGSAVVTAAMTALMVSVYGYNVGLWPTTQLLPAPLNRSAVFVVLTGIFLLLGWQAHVPLTGARVTGIGLGVVAAAIGIVLGRWLAPLPEEATLPLHQALLRKERKVVLLLLGTLLLWPQEALLEPRPIALALLGALVAIFVLHVMLDPVFDLFQIKRRPPDASRVETKEVSSE
jgi:NhaP-type Na+/H+ or K+/H+ antiporter